MLVPVKVAGIPVVADVTLGYWDGEYPGTCVEEYTLLQYKTLKPLGDWIYGKVKSEPALRQEILSRAVGPIDGSVHGL